MIEENHLVSIIIPTYKGEKTIITLIEELIKILENVDYEIVVVNDCSPDKSNELLLDLQNKYPEKITYIKLAKNFGEYNAVMAGLRNCKGHLAVIADDDLQHPPKEILKLIKNSLKSSYDVIYTKFKSYNHSFGRSLLSKIYNFTANITLSSQKKFT